MIHSNSLKSRIGFFALTLSVLGACQGQVSSKRTDAVKSGSQTDLLGCVESPAYLAATTTVVAGDPGAPAAPTFPAQCPGTGDSCSFCPNLGAYIDTYLNGALGLSPNSSAVAKLALSDDFEADRKRCFEIISKMPWENEGKPGSGSDIAHNCRDFTQGYIRCMELLGWPGAVNGLSVHCKNCDDGGSRSHRIVLTKNPKTGEYCPGEPQNPTGGKYSDCCNTDKDKAAQCALEVHCNAKSVACCEPESFKIRAPKECMNEQSCYWDPIKRMYKCNLPVVGDPNGDPVPKDPPDDPVTPEEQKCKDAIRKCIKDHNTAKTPSCPDCRRAKLPECAGANPGSKCAAKMTPGPGQCQWCRDSSSDPWSVKGQCKSGKACGASPPSSAIRPGVVGYGPADCN